MQCYNLNQRSIISQLPWTFLLCWKSYSFFAGTNYKKSYQCCIRGATIGCVDSEICWNIINFSLKCILFSVVEQNFQNLYNFAYVTHLSYD